MATRRTRPSSGPEHSGPATSPAGPGGEDSVQALRVRVARLETALDELEARHRLVLEGVAGAVWEWDIEARTVRFSDRWARLRGYAPGELGDGEEEWTTRIHPDDAERVAAAVQAHLAGETPDFCEEYRLRNKDGTYDWVLDRGVAAHDGEGRATRMAGSTVDVTARRAAEDGPAASLRLLRAAQEMGHVGSWEVDVGTGIESWTDEVFRILGLDPAASDPLLAVYDAAIHPEDRDAVDLAYESTFARGDDAYDMTYRIVRYDDGRVRWVRDQCLHEKDETGRIVRRLGTLQDISEYQLAKQEIAALNEGLERRVHLRTVQLQELNEELESFAYAVSHDLRAPLRAMDGFAHIIAVDYAASLDDEGTAHLERIRVSAQKMGELIDGLLQLSRLSRARLRVEDVDLSRLAREVCDELAAAEPGRRVEVVIRPGLRALADPALAHALLANLLGNAWRFTSQHETARVELGAVEGSEGTTFFVADDGAGFDMAYADKLFGAFQRLHTPGQFDGTGIGLATVQRIVRRHGGRVWAEGAVEQGATFYFTLAEPAAG